MGLGLGIGVDLSLIESVGYTLEAQALFARFTTPPDTARKAVINNLIAALKAAGVWAKLDALYLLAAADAQAAQRNWVQDLYNLTLVNSPTFTADRGYAGNGSSSYLRTNFNPTTAVSPKFVRDSGHASLVDRTSRAAAASVEFGGLISGSGFTAEMATRFTGDSGLLRINDATSPLTVTSAESSGRFVASRTGASALATYRNAVSLGTGVTTSTAPANVEFFIGALSSNGTPALFSTDQIAQVGFGAALSPTEVAAMDAAIATYLTAVGA